MSMTFEEMDKAIKRGDTLKIREALDLGLDPNLANRFGWTILMLAAMSGNTSIGRLLIERGAGLDTRNRFRDTALSLAIHTGHPSFVKLLLDHGASLDCHPHGNSFEIFLDWVAQFGHSETIGHIRTLIEDARRAGDQHDSL